MIKNLQARSQVEKLLSQPTLDIFDLPLGQVYNLLKFDCYPRFLRSDMYRDYCSGAVPLPQYDETSDSDQDSSKSQKLEHDSRRKSLLPWHRSKNKNKNKVNFIIDLSNALGNTELSPFSAIRRIKCTN